MVQLNFILLSYFRVVIKFNVVRNVVFTIKFVLIDFFGNQS